jgi:hypothetical protein
LVTVGRRVLLVCVCRVVRVVVVIHGGLLTPIIEHPTWGGV